MSKGLPSAPLASPMRERAYLAQAATAYRMFRVAAVCVAIGLAGLGTKVGVDVATWNSPHSRNLKTVEREATAVGVALGSTGLVAGFLVLSEMDGYERRNGIESGRFRRAMEKGGLSAL